MDSGCRTSSRVLVAIAALRVMVLQRVKISSVLGLGGTLGALEDFSLSLDPTGPALSELRLEHSSFDRLISGLLLSFCCSSFELEENSLLEEDWEARETLRSLMLSEASRSSWTGVQVSERMSKDLALWRRPGIMVEGSPSSRLFSVLLLYMSESSSSLLVARFRVEL